MTEAGYSTSRKNNTRRLLGLITLLVAVVALCLISVAVGTRVVGWSELWAGLVGRAETIDQAAVVVRIPRTILAALAGAALGLSGAVLQGITRNPLADPGILGINNGAVLAVVIGIAWFQMSVASTYVWVAILGAGATAVFIYTIGSLGRGGATPLKLVLAGAATSVAFSSFTVAIVLPRNDISGGVQSWRVGGVGGATFDRIELILPFIVAGFVIAILSARKLNSLALGDDLAAGLGEKVALVRGVAALSAIMLCGAATAACGPIIFVGLIVPHLCRLLFGVDYRWLLPCSALCGAAMLILADVVGRLVARPGELDVGIVTAFVGAPFFIWIVRRQRVREL